MKAISESKTFCICTSFFLTVIAQSHFEACDMIKVTFLHAVVVASNLVFLKLFKKINFRPLKIEVFTSEKKFK